MSGAARVGCRRWCTVLARVPGPGIRACMVPGVVPRMVPGVVQGVVAGVIAGTGLK